MTYRRILFEFALDHHGLVTTGDARTLGVPPVELAKLAQRGALRNVAYGVYRHDDVPTTRLSQFAEAVVRVGEGAYLVQDAVLAMHDLALVNPSALKVATPRRVRRQLPDWVDVVRSSDADVLTDVEGIACTTVACALIGSVGVVPRDRLRSALEEARRRGLVHRRDVAPVASALHQGVSP